MCDDTPCTECDIERQLAEIKAAAGMGESLARCTARQRLAETLPGLVDAPTYCTPTSTDLELMAESRRLAEGGPYGGRQGPLARGLRGVGLPTSGKADTPASSITADQAEALIAAGEGARVIFVPRDGGPATKASDSYEHHQALRRLAHTSPETRAQVKATALSALGITTKATPARPETAALDRALVAARVKAHHLAERERQESERRLVEHQAFMALKHADEAAAAEVRSGRAEPVRVSARNGRPIKGQAQLEAEAQERARVVREADRIQAEKASDLAKIEAVTQRRRSAARPSILGLPPKAPA
jgi:hypothetical protein